MEYHPYSEIWPLLEGAEFDKLKADIEANGLLLPIITYKNKILDGRNRDRACRASGVRVRYEEAKARNDDDALKLVWSLNDHRRHLSVAQRAFAAAKMANMMEGRPKKTLPTGRVSEGQSATVSVKQAADITGVSPGSIARARVVLADGTSKDIADTMSGKVSLQAKASELRPVKKPRGPRAVPERQRLGRPARPNLVGTVGTPLQSRTAGLNLTRQQVDPEFTGTPTEWTDKYGHVQIMTAEQYATSRFSDWVHAAREIVKCWRQLPEFEARAVDHNWLRSPKPRDIARLTEALEFLRPKVRELEALLATAVASERQKQKAD